MDQITASPKLAWARVARLVRFLLPVAILWALIGGLFAYQVRTARQQASSQAAAERVSPEVLEERYGMRIKLIGVTAGGGLIDFRFKVLDQEKAGLLLESPADIPVLIVEDSGTTLKPPEVKAQDIQLESDSVYLILYPNTEGAIKPGTLVSVVMGDVRLEPILAQ